MEIEFHQLERRYAALRIPDPPRQARLLASLSEHGQQHPVLVVPKAERFVLIEGYCRVDALERLGRDSVEALVVELDEAEALILAHRLERERPHGALEESLLLRELVESHGKRQFELAVAFARSESWISRRLALLGVLPECAVAAVRRGVLGAHAAMKCLVPLARAKREHCERLVAGLGSTKVSDRQMAALWAAYRAGTAAQREKIVTSPLLHLAIEQEMKAPEPPAEEPDRLLVKDFGVLAAASARARKGVERRERSLPWPSVLRFSWQEAQAAFATLVATVAEGRLDA